MTRLRWGAALVVVGTTGAAHAEPEPLLDAAEDVAIEAGRDVPALRAGGDEPIAITVGEELGLEPGPGRRGVVATLVVAPIMQLGIGVDGIDGLGGGVDLRLAEVASPHWLLGVEVAVGGVARRRATGTEVEQVSAVVVSGQFYARPGLWFRIGSGFGALTRRDQATGVVGASRGGLGGVVGAGISLVQGRHVGLALEAFVVGGLVRGAAVGFGGVGLALSID